MGAFFFEMSIYRDNDITKTCNAKLSRHRDINITRSRDNEICSRKIGTLLRTALRLSCIELLYLHERERSSSAAYQVPISCLSDPYRSCWRVKSAEVVRKMSLCKHKRLPARRVYSSKHTAKCFKARLFRYHYRHGWRELCLVLK